MGEFANEIAAHQRRAPCSSIDADDRGEDDEVESTFDVPQLQVQECADFEVPCYNQPDAKG